MTTGRTERYIHIWNRTSDMLKFIILNRQQSVWILLLRDVAVPITILLLIKPQPLAQLVSWALYFWTLQHLWLLQANDIVVLMFLNTQQIKYRNKSICVFTIYYCICLACKDHTNIATHCQKDVKVQVA